MTLTLTVIIAMAITRAMIVVTSNQGSHRSYKILKV